MKNVFFYNYPIGLIGIAEENAAICRVFFSTDKRLAGFKNIASPVIRAAHVQLTEYFAGQRTTFDLPLALQGTTFQMAVWQALQTIPAGEVRSYKALAAMIGKPQASRAVGRANHDNPILIIVPCHRVTGADGSLTGYVGGLHIKQHLLELEKYNE